MGEIEIFSKRLKEIRESLKMTQTQFSGFIGVKQQTLSGYERGIMKPPLDVAKLIAQKCNVSIDWLCGLSERKRNDDTLQTYADIIDLLVRIENTIKFEIVPQNGNCITIRDSVMQCFIRDWNKTLPLYHNGTIDEELYKLWVDNKIREFKNVRIGNKDDIEEFLTLMEVIGSPILSTKKPDEPPQE